jgi:hypothetical protein
MVPKKSKLRIICKKAGAPKNRSISRSEKHYLCLPSTIVAGAEIRLMTIVAGAEELLSYGRKFYCRRGGRIIVLRAEEISEENAVSIRIFSWGEYLNTLNILNNVITLNAHL